MSKEKVYNLIKEKTLNKSDELNNQVKITAKEIIKELDLNEQTVYANLRNLKEVSLETYKTRMFRNGKKYIFKKKLYWIEE